MSDDADLLSLLNVLRQALPMANLIQALQPQRLPQEQLGYLPGSANLNPQTAISNVPRPFAPGEWLQNPDGSWSNERTTTVAPGDEPQLMGGRAAVIPRLWVLNGKPYLASEDEAAQFAAKSGLSFPAFNSLDEAEKFANMRESNWQNIKPQNSGSVPSLWTRPTVQPNSATINPPPVQVSDNKTKLDQALSLYRLNQGDPNLSDIQRYIMMQNTGRRPPTIGDIPPGDVPGDPVIQQRKSFIERPLYSSPPQRLYSPSRGKFQEM